MSIDLTGIPIRSAELFLQDFGGTLTPPTGGVVQRIDRMGTRYGMTVETAPMPLEDARAWHAKLLRARRDGALLAVSQPGISTGSPGTPVVASDTASGRSIGLSGCTPSYELKAGQWVSFIHSSQRYLDQARADATVTGGGTVTLTIQNLLRTPLTAGDTVEVETPMIEGSIEGVPLSIPVERMTAFTFTILEDA